MITKVEFKENSQLNKNATKNRRRHFIRRPAPVDKRKYPKEVLLAFKYDYEKCDIFYKTMYGYMCGRHILDISPLYVYNLQNGITSKKMSLAAFFKYEDAVKLDFDHLPAKAINRLSELAFSMIYKGITIKLSSLDLNYFMSTDKIINAGNVIKNHNGTELYGGNTIRSFLTHFCVNESDSIATEEELNNMADIIKNKIIELKDYNAVKSIPFSIFRYSLYIKIDEDGKITTPDIEAKHNIRKILGQEIYYKYHFEKLSMIRATFFESKLIRQIKKTMTKEMNTIANELLIDIPEGCLKEHAILVSSIDNITIITDSGIIHDIVSYMMTNIKGLKTLSEPENSSRPLTEDEKKSLFQIEYTAIRSGQSGLETDPMWLSEISMAIKAEYATFNKLLLCIDSKFAPIINEKSILDYNVDYNTFKAFYDKYITYNTEEYIQENENNILTAFCEIPGVLDNNINKGE